MVTNNYNDDSAWDRIDFWPVFYYVFCFIAVLLLAYMKGNANLCRAIVRAGARLGVNNNQGINIFNYQVATKQLLFRLLGDFASFVIDRVSI